MGVFLGCGEEDKSFMHEGQVQQEQTDEKTAPEAAC